MKTSTPLVSVVIPAYNGARYISETLESAYRQTYRNWEIIVIDDGSTDGTKAVLGPHMHRIRYVYQENMGTPAARNAGVRWARGELIAFLDNDDLWLPEKLERQVLATQIWPECGLVFTDGKTFDDLGIRKNSVISSRLDRWIHENQTEDPMVRKGWLSRELFFANEICSASSVLIRKECMEYVGDFDETIRVADDYDLWLRIAQRYPVALIRSCLYMWRWRDDSQSGPLRDRQHRWKEASMTVLEKHLSAAPMEIRGAVRTHLARMYRDCAKDYFRLDQFGHSRRMLVESLRYNRFSFSAVLLFLLSYLRPSLISRVRHMKRHVEMRAKNCGISRRPGMLTGYRREENHESIVSVIICTRNRAKSLQATLTSLEKLEIPAGWTWEVLVVENASTDETEATLRACVQQESLPLRWVREEKIGLSSARNRGFHEARGAILVYTDDDVIVTEAWLQGLIREFERNADTLVVGGRTLPLRSDLPPQGLKLEDCRREFRWPFSPGEVIGNNMAFRRDVFSRVGLFDPRLGAGRFFGAYEDSDFVYRALKRGGRGVYTPDAVIYHNHDRVAPSVVRRFHTNYATGRGAFLMKHVLRGDLFAARMAYWWLAYVIKEFFTGVWKLEWSRVSWAVHRLFWWSTGALAWLPVEAWRFITSDRRHEVTPYQ